MIKKGCGWTHPDGHKTGLDFYVDRICCHAQAEVISKQHNFKNSTAIIVKRADNEAAVIIVNISDMRLQGNSTMTFYRTQLSDPTEEYQKDLHNLMKEFPTKVQIKSHTSEEPQLDIFYLLPKLQKPWHFRCPISLGFRYHHRWGVWIYGLCLKAICHQYSCLVLNTTNFLRK